MVLAPLVRRHRFCCESDCCLAVMSTTKWFVDPEAAGEAIMRVSVRTSLFLTVVALLTGACADSPTAPPTAPSAIVPQELRRYAFTEQDAYEISAAYTHRDFTTPFGVSDDEFFEDPESITDSQFEAHGPALV